MNARASVALSLLLFLSPGALADDLSRAQELAWAKRFAESEALYRRVLAAQPRSAEAQLGLARVVMWQGRYDEAIRLFEAIDGVDALEGKGTAQYWGGDLRGASRTFRRVLERDPSRETARDLLREIRATARPSQRISVDGSTDDQPLDALRVEAGATFFSDPQTQWTVTAGRYTLEAERLERETSGTYVTAGGQAAFRDVTVGATLGAFTFPDGVRGAVGSVMVRRGALTLQVERRPEIATATALTTHTASTTTMLRWSHDGRWLGAAEASHRRYNDDNSGTALVAWGVVPMKRGNWTFWWGASGAARDTEESRFRLTAVSSTRELDVFRYRYRGEYDPYWTPQNLFEVRAVVALERRFSIGNAKLQADGGYARDRGVTFGPDTGPGPLPISPVAVAFDRTWHPWRVGLTTDLRVGGDFRLEAGVERSVTVDYRVTSFHAALVRRR